MAKRLCITVSNWVYDQYLIDIKVNRSKFIEEMLVKGVQLETGEYEASKGRVSSLLQQLRNKDEEIKKLTLINNNFKKKFEEEEDKGAVEKRHEIEKLVDGLRANNPLWFEDR